MSIGWNRGLVVGGRSICEEFDLKGLCSAIQFNCPIKSMKAIHPKLLTCRRNKDRKNVEIVIFIISTAMIKCLRNSIIIRHRIPKFKTMLFYDYHPRAIGIRVSRSDQTPSVVYLVLQFPGSHVNSHQQEHPFTTYSPINKCSNKSKFVFEKKIASGDLGKRHC